MTFIRAYRWEIIVVLLAFVAHAVCFLLVVHAYHDSVVSAVHGDDGYFEISTNILAGNGYSSATTTPYLPNALRTPGYIYFLVASFRATGSWTGVALLQMLLACALPLLGMRIAQRLARSNGIGIAAGILLALDPTLALLSFQFYTETFFLVLFFLWLLLTFRYLEAPRWSTLSASAVLLGVAILTKTSAQYIPLILVPFILWQSGRREWRRGIAHAGVYLFIIALILTPWVIRNTHTFGVPGLSAQTPFVFYTNFAPAVLTVARGSDFAEEVSTFSTVAERDSNAITLANGDIYIAKALEVVRAHPVAAVFVACKSLFTFFTNDGVYTLLARSGHAPYDFLWLLIAARLVWVAITLAACVGALVYLFRERSSLAILILLLVAYFALTSTIAAFGTNPRYRLPVDPILIALAGIGIASTVAYLRRFRASA
jgi:4-amino-4-deoxy-L-arabinose transferase-like glycosyltransferase